MLRSLLGACRFSRVSAKVALSISFVPLIISIFWAGVLFSGAGCSSCDSWRLNSALDFKPAGKADFSEMQPSPQPDMNIPNVTRSQKPDDQAPKGAAGGSLLDQVTYIVPAPSAGEVAARIRATVNGKPILDEEVREAIYPYLLATQTLPEPERSQKRAEFFNQELQHLIEREVILQDMFGKLKDRAVVLDKLKEAAGKEFDKKMREQRNRLKIKTDEELKAYLRTQGLTVEGVRRQMETSFMAMEYMRNRIMPSLDRAATLEQIVEYYNKHPEEFEVQDSVTWQDIFIDAGKYPSREAARQAAEAIVAKARQGADFLQLVGQFDNGDSSYRNGEGWGHRHGEIKPPEAETILFKMTAGEIGPLVQQTNGFHVIRLAKREYAGIKPFDENVQKSIRNKLEAEVWEREYKRLLADLKRRATIEISTGVH